MSKTYIITNSPQDYFFPYVKKNKIKFVNLNKNSRIDKVIIRYLIKKYGINLHYFFTKQWEMNISDKDTLILLDSAYITGLGKYLRKRFPENKTYLFFWNHLESDQEKILNDFGDYSNTWTFVKEDSQKYKIKFNSTFYSNEIKINNDEILLFDLLFVGREKGKLKKLINLEKHLNEKGLKAKFHILNSMKDSNYNCEEKKYLTDSYLSYKENLNLISKSSAILDFGEPGNTGYSMRVMEAIFFGKKLVSNNQKLYEEKFYNSDYIYIINDDDNINFKELTSFLTKKVNISYENEKKYFDINNWISRFH